MNKRILWILLLILVIVGIVLGIKFIKPKDQNNETSIGNKNVNTIDGNVLNQYEDIYNNMENAAKAENEINNASKMGSGTPYIKTQENDGILYSKEGKKKDGDFKVKDEYFDTTINDLWLNSEEYQGETIEIEGMYLLNGSYTFVGRYSTSSVCPNCPAGYSVMEFQLDGSIDKILKNEDDWIKVVGTLEKGKDEGSYGMEYLYLKVVSIEIMNEAGNKTVTN